MSKLLVKNGLVYDAVTREPKNVDVLAADGKIVRIEAGIEDAEAVVIDAQGKRVYPGFIDAHTHIGLDTSFAAYESDYNEMNGPVTPQIRAIDGYNPMDRSIELARKGGVTTICTGPGSANVLGGTFVAVKTYGKRVDDVVVKEEAAMKAAFGENPKRCYKDKAITSRMTTAAILRTNLCKAHEYQRKLDAAGEDGDKLPTYDPVMEALLPVIRGEMPIKAHAHRADDIFTAIRIAKEFGIKLTLEHVTDGALIAEDLAKEHFPCAVGPSPGHPSKLELANKGFETPGILSKAGCDVSIITDAGVIPQEYLSLCAGLAVKAGMDPFEALKAITINPAKHIGIADRVGSIEVGKDADLVIADGDPMLSDTRILHVIIDGEER